MTIPPTEVAIPTIQPIKFGTDGWRGRIAAEFTFDRVMQVAPLAAQVLAETYGGPNSGRKNTIVVGFDRRFLSEDFARATAAVVQAAGFDVLLAEDFAPTPLFSWVAHDRDALGALVITASHNPGIYSGLKVKGGFGGSVPPEVTKAIEARLHTDQPRLGVAPGQLQTFDPWTSGYGEALQSMVDIAAIRSAIASGQLMVFADVMHGAAAGGLARLLGAPVQELRSNRDPLFGGGAPEPLPRYLGELIQQLKTYGQQATNLAIGLVFDGDCDRVAAVDGQGEFHSSQVLIPVLIEHLATRRQRTGELVKTVSGSDLIPKVASLFNLPIYETPVGYKYIADRMLDTQVLLGGEESGGIGYGHHIPERDALLSALYVLEAVTQANTDLGELYRTLQDKTNCHTVYDRIDLPLANMEARTRLLEQLQNQPLQEIAGMPVLNCQTIDGYKFRLAEGHWLMIRFSGTEPVLRLYCEGPTSEQVQKTLIWAKDWATA